MNTLYANDILSMTEDEIWSMPDETYTLAFDDGEIVTNTRRTIYSWYHWEILRELNVGLKKRHHMGKGYLTVNTTLDIMSYISEDVHYTYGEDGYDREHLWKRIYETVNHIYNVFIVKLAPYQTSSNIMDYIQIYRQKDVAEANANLRPTQAGLDAAYAKITHATMKAPELDRNPVARATRMGLVKQDQVNQIVGPRGYMTDADSNVFSDEPLMTGYLEGVTSAYGTLIESRSAVKALIFTKNPLQVVEYFNRKMQLATSYVKTLHKGDCGSTHYAEIFMDVGMLKGFEGKYFLNESTNKLEPITLQRRDLHHKLLKIRTPTKCHYGKDGGVCYTCFGQLAYQVPENTNLGHVSSSEMCQEGSQLVLSVKHYDGSSVVMVIEFSDHDKQFIYEGTDPGTLFFQHGLMGREAYLVLDTVERPPVIGGAGLSAIKPSTNVYDLSIHSITKFKDVKIGFTNNKGELVESYISVSQGSRLGSLTHEFLAYVQDVGFTILDDGSYRIELKGWDFDKPVLALPMKHRNMLDYMSDIEDFLRSPQDTGRDSRTSIATPKLIDYDSIDKAIIDLYDLVSSKLSVNVAHLEILILAMMRSADDPDNYNFPEVGEPFMFERHRRLMERRSLGGELAYERQPAVLEDVDSFLIRDRMSHVLDPMVM